jgi:hypothetical protein
MNRFTYLKYGILVATLSVLAGCGGGGDAAGSPSGFQVSPSTVTITAAKTDTTCSAPADAGQFFIYGGVAPYRVDNAQPSYVTVSPSTVDHPGGSFSVTFLGGCMSPGTLSVSDATNHVITVTLNYKAGS